MSDLPEGFLRTTVDGAVLVLRADVADALRAGGCADPAALRAAATATFSGRGEPFALPVDGVGDVFVRPYLHGGLLAPLTGDRFSGDKRFLGEVRALAACQGTGVPVPEVFGYVSRPAALGLRRGWLLTRALPAAQDLLTFLSHASPQARRMALETGGRACRSLHDAGVEHPDLHWKNLLVAAPDHVLILDLDGARLHSGELARPERKAALLRCDRYAAKQAAKGHPVSRTDRLRFLRAYAASDWPARDEARQWAAEMARHIGRHQSALSADGVPVPARAENGA